MAAKAIGVQWHEFNSRLVRLAQQRGRELKVLGRPERSVVELDGRPYVVFVPTSTMELTPSRVVTRTLSWRSLRGRTPAGYVILAPQADLSKSMRGLRAFDAPFRTAVVARWGRQNDLAISTIDDDMALILEAAGVHEPIVVDALQRSMSGSLSQEPSSIGSANEPAPTSTRMLRQGHVIDAYRLEDRLGRGHSAVVWKATVIGNIPGVELERGQSVAMKLYLPALVQGFETLRIQREFAVAAELRHPNLARVFDLVLSPSRPHHAFMVMEYIEGSTLKTVIEARGKLTANQVVRLAEQLFSALEEVHSQDALHRDVKAANIMVPNHSDNDLVIKLVDLGIVAVPSEERLTQASVFLGSKHSAPLEQLTGQPLDERTDIYGAGSVLFHALTGRPMYNNAGPEGAIVVQMLNSPDRLAAVDDRGKSEDSLAAFINRCIAVKSSDRPTSARECLDELRRIRSRAI